MSQAEHPLWSDSPDTGTSSPWPWEEWHEWDGKSFFLYGVDGRFPDEESLTSLLHARSEFSLTEWLTTSSYLLGRTPNPVTFDSAKYNKYGSIAFGEVKLQSNPVLVLK